MNASFRVVLDEIAGKRKRRPEQHLALLGKSVPSFVAREGSVRLACHARGLT